MPRVLITGAAGFIGMHTSIRFLREGWDVTGLDNFNDYYDVSLKRDRIKHIKDIPLKNSGSFKIIEANINSEIWKHLESYEFDVIIHLAAQAGVRYSLENPRAYLESNIMGFQSVIEYAIRTNQKRFLYASSSSVYGKNSNQPFSELASCDAPESYYAATKRANELMAKSYFHTKGLTSVGLRFFTVYGPWGRPDMAPMLFAKAGTLNEPIRVFNHGKQERDFTYVDDIVEGIFLLATMENFPKSSLVCNIGNGAPVGLMNFISLLEESLGKEFSKEYVDAQKGDVESTYADTSRLESLVKYCPKTSLAEGIPAFLKWYKDYYNV